MNGLRAAVALAFVAIAVQSCTQDFDQFDASGSTAGNTSIAGNISIGGTTSKGGTTGKGGALNAGGSIAKGGSGGTASTGGTAGSAQAGAPSEAGSSSQAGAAGAGPEPIPCGGPCILDHAAAACIEDACAVASCDDTWGDCNTTASDGCETAVMSNNATHCGSCENKCQTGFACIDGQCSCDFKNDCGNGSGVECSNHLCSCDQTACRPGERCRDAQGAKLCSCNGGAGCAANELCCSNGGCADGLTDAANCGACGHACTLGFACIAGECGCDSAEDCGGVTPPDTGSGGAGGDAGASSTSGAPGTAGAPASGITCQAGKCVCDGTTCGVGQRCLANGSCG